MSICETAAVVINRAKSALAYKKACEVMPSGVSSPVRSFKSVGQSPLVVEAGYLDEIYDVDGNRYIDYCGSWGALIHGHTHPLVVEAAQKQLAKGSSFGICTPSEEKLARKIVQLVPSVEKVRFISSGTEATMTALRLARGYTGRDLFVKFIGSYHGHADPFLVESGSETAVLSSSSAGVPYDSIKNTLSIPFNDFDAVRDVMKRPNIAAIIIEPVAANMGVVPPKEGFLQLVREQATRAGALLIFDEVITGFRVARGGAQALYGITPDLTTFGKIVGGGFAAAALGGKAKIMDHLAPQGAVYQAGTLSGNPVAMEAGLQALQLLEERDFYQTLEEKTNILTKPLAQMIAKRGLPLTLHQVGSAFTLFFGQKTIENFADVKKCDFARFNHFFSHLLQRGIYFSPSQYEANFVSMAHSNSHLEYTRDLIIKYLDEN